MRDRFFFPLILAIAGAMIFSSLRVGAAQLPSGPWSGAGSDYNVLTLEGRSLARLITGDNASTRLIGSGETALLRLDVSTENLPDNPEAGPHFQIASDLETVFAGATLNIIVRAKPGAERGADTFEVNYRAGRAGESGWNSFALTSETSRDYSFIYEVPLHSGDPGYDYLGVRPFADNAGATLDIERVTIRHIGRWAKDNS